MQTITPLSGLSDGCHGCELMLQDEDDEIPPITAARPHINTQRLQQRLNCV